MLSSRVCFYSLLDITPPVTPALSSSSITTSTSSLTVTPSPSPQPNEGQMQSNSMQINSQTTVINNITVSTLRDQVVFVSFYFLQISPTLNFQAANSPTPKLKPSLLEPILPQKSNKKDSWA